MYILSLIYSRKTQNLLVKSRPPGRWWIKIADFGTTKRIGESCQSHTRVGTLHFMAPELFGGTGSIDEYAADMWSVGEIAFQILTNRPSFGTNFFLLTAYINNPQKFPVNVLIDCEVSNSGQEFILSAMCPTPDGRLKASQGLQHSWFADFKMEYMSKSYASCTFMDYRSV